MRLPLIIASALFILSASVLSANEPININTASAQELADAISGVGLKRAEMIIKYRTQYGPFVSVDDLGNVDGIGEKTIEKSRSQLTVE